MGNCFDCEHQNIVETSDEWIDCFCKAQNGKKTSVYTNNCELYKRVRTTEEKYRDDKQYLHSLVVGYSSQNLSAGEKADKIVNAMDEYIDKWYVRR